MWAKIIPSVGAKTRLGINNSLTLDSCASRLKFVPL